MANLYDAILVGAGHNGLVAAAYLARAGQKVLVLERRNIVGGAVVTEELREAPGFKFDTCAHGGQLSPDIVRDLDLTRHGLETLTIPSTIFSPLPDGGHLLLSPDNFRATEAIRRFSRADADKWVPFTTLITRVAALLREAYALTAPRVPNISPAEMPALARLGWQLRGLGKKDMVEALRLLPMSIAEVLDEWFESDALKGALAAQGIQGIRQGPMGAGTAFVFLHHWVINGGLFKPTVRGGMGQMTQALAAAAKRFGADIRTGAEVAQILVKDDGAAGVARASGVALASGEEIGARLVVSNADPRRTFLGLVDPLNLEPQFVRAVQNIKLRGVSAKVNLALSELPEFNAPADCLRGTISISPSVKYLERAYDDAKYGSCSQKPYLEIVIPSLTDPSLVADHRSGAPGTPAGQQVMSIFVQYAPYHLKDGAWEAKREAFGEAVIETLAEYAPNIKSAILHRQVLTPWDLENTYGLTEGNIHHGELTLDQVLFMRPVPGWAQYRTPIENLYLCGAGTHPGGGVTGAPGRNAAKQILKDLKG